VSDSRIQGLSRIRRAAALVTLRLRVMRAIRYLPTALTFALAVVAGTLACRKLLPAFVSEHHARQVLWGAGIFVVVVALVGLLRRLAPNAGTVLLDKHHGLHDRLTNALAFDSVAGAERTALMEVAIDDACEHAANLKPSKAAPIRLNADYFAPVLVGLGVLAIALLEIRTPIKDATPMAKTIDAIALSADDIDLFRDAAKELAKRDQSPEVQAAVERFNQLIEDIANKRLDRTEAFRKMEAIERDLLKGAEADRKALEEALNQMGKDLESSDLAKPLAESLKKNDLQKAQKDLKELAERLKEKDGKKKPDKAALEKLRDALRKASERQKDSLAAINEKRAETREELLKKKQRKNENDAGAQDEKEERLLKKKERELERLDREAEQKERVGRQLDKLDRQLAKAAEDLLREMGASAEDLQQAAEDLNRMQEEAMSEKEKEELRQRLEELRDLLRQQGQAGKQRMSRMLRFGKRARGGSGKGQQQGQDQGQGQEGQDGQEGQEGQDGQEGQEGKQGQNGPSGNQGGQGKQWVIGPGGKKMLVLSQGGGQGQGEGQGEGQGQGQGQNGGQGTEPGGKGIGSGHDGNIAGKRTDPKMGTADVQAQGLDSGDGPSNSEVILAAAERGFKGGGYKKVFTQYRTVAEEQINKEKVPDGYRFYVQRYFQLIRPRE